MTHESWTSKKCNGNAAGCHPQKADCDNNVGGFNCNCKYYKYKYGDGYDCFEDLNFLIFSSKEPKSDEQKSEFVKMLTIRTRLNQVDWKHTLETMSIGNIKIAWKQKNYIGGEL